MNIADLKKLAGIGEHKEEPSMGENISHTATGLEDHTCKDHTSLEDVKNEDKKFDTERI